MVESGFRIPCHSGWSCEAVEKCEDSQDLAVKTTTVLAKE
jgi:hypothetical protein